MNEQLSTEPTIEQKLDIMYAYLVSIEAKLDHLIRALEDEDLGDADISPFGLERDQGQTL